MKKKFIKTAAASAILLTTLIPTSFANADVLTTKQLDETIKVRVNHKDDVKKALQVAPVKKLRDNAAQYKVTKVEKDKEGFTHYTVVPEVNGVKSLGAEIKVHADANGKVTLINGEISQGAVNPTNTKKLSAEDAVEIAYKSINVTPDEVRDFKNFPTLKHSNLVINPTVNKYVYDIRIGYMYPSLANWYIQVDAETGEVVKRANILQHVSEPRPGTTYASRGVSLSGAYKPINVFKFSTDSFYTLADYTSKTPIETYNANHADELTVNQMATLITDKDRIFKADKAAVDAHYYAKLTYDYYKNTFNRESFDGYGAPIYSAVHFLYNENNAYWTGTAMVYGDGDGRQFSPLSGARDVVAHELTHAVTNSTARLAYEFQSGALNESYSDVMAWFVDPDWLLGEDVTTPYISGDALRSFSRPEDYWQPSHMDNFEKLTYDQDFGGVHVNSGIPNKAFYNLIEVQKMDPKKAEQIYYRTLTKYLTSYSNFKDNKAALIRSANDIYGPEEAQKIKLSQESVGIY